MRKMRHVDLRLNFFEEFACAGAHGGRAGVERFFEELFNGFALGCVIMGQVGEGLEAEGFYDRTAIV